MSAVGTSIATLTSTAPFPITTAPTSIARIHSDGSSSFNISAIVPTGSTPTPNPDVDFVEDGREMGSKKAIGFVLPVMGIVLGIVVLLTLFIIRHIHVKRKRQRRLLDQSDLDGSISAEELVSGVRTPTRNRTRHGGAGLYDQAQLDAASAGAVQHRRRRRGARGLRRTESGNTIKTLPEYSKEAGEEEVVLVRRRSSENMADEVAEQASIRPDLTAPTRRPSMADLIRGSVDTLRRTTSLLSVGSNRRSQSVVVPAVHDQQHTGDRPSESNMEVMASPLPIRTDRSTSPARPASSAETLSTMADPPGEHAPSTLRTTSLARPLIETRPAPPYHPTRTNTSLSSGIERGDAPTYLEAMSSFVPGVADDALASPPTASQQRLNIRDRTSLGIRTILNRAHLRPHPPAPSPLHTTASRPHSLIAFAHSRNVSSSSSTIGHLFRPTPIPLSLHPNPSLPSIHSAPSHSSIHRSSAIYSHPHTATYSNRQSTQSLVIGSPIPSTAIRASFVLEDLPRAGLSDEQMKWLSSSEAIDLVGMRMDGVVSIRKGDGNGNGNGDGDGLLNGHVDRHGDGSGNGERDGDGRHHGDEDAQEVGRAILVDTVRDE